MTLPVPVLVLVLAGAGMLAGPLRIFIGCCGLALAVRRGVSAYR